MNQKPAQGPDERTSGMAVAAFSVFIAVVAVFVCVLVTLLTVQSRPSVPGGEEIGSGAQSGEQTAEPGPSSPVFSPTGAVILPQATDRTQTVTTQIASDYAVLYSSNIGRFTMDYSSPDTTNREREAAYRMCIDLRNRDFAFLDRRMAIFLNGKYIPYGYYREEVPGLIEIGGFKEIIATVDILYSKTDQCLIDLKKAAYPYCPEIDDTTYIQRPEKNYAKMEPIKVYDYTSRGYYDILLNEYIFNGKLERILRYLEEHPEEADEFRRDLVQKFHAISDIDLNGESDHTARIVLSGNAYHDHVYQIGITE